MFSGNTSPQDLNGRGVGVNSTVNFAVLDRSGNDPTDPWGTGYKGFTDTFVSGSAKKQILDTKAKYLLPVSGHQQPSGPAVKI